MKQNHITVTGDLGSGKTTAATELARVLDADFSSTGQLQRKIAESLNASTLDVNLLAEQDKAIDTQIDDHTAELARSATKPIVFDSRMAWHVVPESFKVRLLIDPEVAVQRISSRAPSQAEKYSSTEEVRSKIQERYRSEVRRFITRYNVDITLISHFDLVVDTSDLNMQGPIDLILKSLQNPDVDSVLISPKRIMPAFSETVAGDDTSTGIQVIYSRPFFFAVSGQEQLAAAIKDGHPVVPVSVVAEGDELLPNGLRAVDYMTKGCDHDEINQWASQHSLDFSGLKAWVG